MLKDITIGQYYPGQSAVHRLDPRGKLIFTVLFVALLFMAQSLMGIVICSLFVVALYPLSGIPLRMLQKSLKPIVLIVAITSLLNMFFIAGRPVFTLWFLTVTWEGILFAVMMSLRFVALIAGTSLLTYTTSPIALTDALERLLRPLKKIKFPAHELSMMMTIALRFIPALMEETGKIMSAQKARGAAFEEGGLRARARALVPILIPLFVSAFRRADELAMAMECRCYRGDEGRTRMRMLHFGSVDAAALGAFLLLAAGVVAANLLFPAPR